MIKLTVNEICRDAIDGIHAVSIETVGFWTQDIEDLVIKWVEANNAFKLRDVIENFDSFAAKCIPDEKKDAFFAALKSKEKAEDPLGHVIKD